MIEEASAEEDVALGVEAEALEVAEAALYSANAEESAITLGFREEKAIGIKQKAEHPRIWRSPKYSNIGNVRFGGQICRFGVGFADMVG